MTVRVAVADDDRDYRLLVRLAVEGHAEVAFAGEASTGEELVDLVAGGGVDLVLLDASLAGAGETVARLREEAPAVPVALTSSLPPNMVATTVARLGALGSLAKDIPPRDLPAAIAELGAFTVAIERSLRTTRVALPHDLQSARASRGVARSTLAGWCDDDVRESALLLISELVTNGIRQAGTDLDVRIALGSDVLRVEVCDRDPTLPVMRTPAISDTGGRGMRLVDQLSLRWGVQARRSGKCVWFELPRAVL